MAWSASLPRSSEYLSMATWFMLRPPFDFSVAQSTRGVFLSSPQSCAVGSQARHGSSAASHRAADCENSPAFVLRRKSSTISGNRTPSPIKGTDISAVSIPSQELTEKVENCARFLTYTDPSMARDKVAISSAGLSG